MRTGRPSAAPLAPRAQATAKIATDLTRGEALAELDGLVAQLRGGADLSIADNTRFLQLYKVLGPTDRRETFKATQRALIGQPGGPTHELRSLKKAKLQDLVKLLLGDKPKQAAEQLDEASGKLTSRLMKMSDAELESSDADWLRNAVTDMKLLQMELEMSPHSRPGDDFSIRLEAQVEWSTRPELPMNLQEYLPGSSGGMAVAGVHFGAKNLETEERKTERYFGAGPKVPFGALLWLRKSRPRGVEKDDWEPEQVLEKIVRVGAPGVPVEVGFSKGSLFGPEGTPDPDIIRARQWFKALGVSVGLGEGEDGAMIVAGKVGFGFKVGAEGALTGPRTAEAAHAVKKAVVSVGRAIAAPFRREPPPDDFEP